MNISFTKKEKKGLNPSELIANRESITLEIKDLWGRIYSNNIIPIGAKQKFDLNIIYKLILSREKELVDTKLSIQAINVGFTSVKQFPKNGKDHTVDIYMLQQLKERKVKLEKLPTRKNEEETVVLTKSFVEKELLEIGLELKKIQQKIDKFNSGATIVGE